MSWLWILLAAGACAEALMLGLIIRKEHPPQPARAQVMIVLGARVRNNRPSHTLRLRLDAACKAYRQGLGEKILVSGGRRHGGVKEADIMAQYLVDAGIPAAHVIREAKSFHTSENLRESKRIMEQHGYISAILVTSGYHLLRACWQAKRMSLEAGAIAASAAPGQLWYGRIRETVAIAKYIILGT